MTAAKKTPAKKTPAKKTPAAKTAAKKTPAAKTAAKKTPAAKTAAKTTAKKTSPGFSDDERAAMKERAGELRAARRGGTKESAADALLAKIAEMQQEDRALAERIHAIITSAAPELSAKTWYGMPAYAKDGKIVCFFQPAQRFSTRYATLGFNDPAHLDDGTMWPTAFAVTDLSDADVTRIEELVKRAVS
jgi:uncharacterized protein YdhG (YjbR/CyaY superfamily)